MTNIYSFLEESLLLQGENAISKATFSELERQLDEYREFSIKLLQDRIKIGIGSGPIRGFTGGIHFDEQMLKQAALYFDEFIVPDPLFAVTESLDNVERNDIADAIFGPSDITSKYDYENDIRNRVLEATKILNRMKKVSDFGYLDFLPTTYLKEIDNKENLRLKLMNTALDDVHKTICDNYFISNEEITLGGNGYKELSVNQMFRDYEDNLPREMIVPMAMMQIPIGEDNGKTYLTGKSYPSEEFNRKQVDFLVQQGKLNYYKESILISRINGALADSLNAHIVTKSKLTNELLSSQGIPFNATTSTFINSKIPIITSVDFEQLLKIRQDYGESFSEFRRQLTSMLDDITLVQDSKNIEQYVQKRVEGAFDESIEKINNEIKKYDRGLLVNTMINYAQLVGQTTSYVNDIASLATAVIQELLEFYDHKKNLKRNPAYFIWQLNREV